MANCRLSEHKGSGYLKWPNCHKASRKGVLKEILENFCSFYGLSQTCAAFAAFYKWLQQEYCANAVLHFGMHGTVEWLPGAPLGDFHHTLPCTSLMSPSLRAVARIGCVQLSHLTTPHHTTMVCVMVQNPITCPAGVDDTALSAGNSGFSWSDVLLGDLPNVYVYAANNPSESIIAKRRGYGTIVSHNVPPYGRHAPRPQPEPAHSMRAHAWGLRCCDSSLLCDTSAFWAGHALCPKAC